MLKLPIIAQQQREKAKERAEEREEEKDRLAKALADDIKNNKGVGDKSETQTIVGSNLNSSTVKASKGKQQQETISAIAGAPELQYKKYQEQANEIFKARNLMSSKHDQKLMRSPQKPKGKRGNSSRSRMGMSQTGTSFAGTTMMDGTSIAGNDVSGINSKQVWWNGARKATHLNHKRDNKEDRITEFNTKFGDRDDVQKVLEHQRNKVTNKNPTLEKLNIHVYDKAQTKKHELRSNIQDKIQDVIAEFKLGAWNAPCQWSSLAKSQNGYLRREQCEADHAEVKCPKHTNVLGPGDYDEFKFSNYENRLSFIYPPPSKQNLMKWQKPFEYKENVNKVKPVNSCTSTYAHKSLSKAWKTDLKHSQSYKMEVSRIKAKHNYELTKDYYLELKEFRNDNAKTENLNICHPYAIETGACSETNKIKELILRKVYNEIMATENRKKAFKYVKDKLAKEKEEEEEQNNFSPEKRQRNQAMSTIDSNMGGVGKKGEAQTNASLNKSALSTLGGSKKRSRSQAPKIVTVEEDFFDMSNAPTKLLRPQDGNARPDLKMDKKSSGGRSSRARSTMGLSTNSKASENFGEKTIEQIEEMIKANEKIMGEKMKERDKCRGNKLKSQCTVQQNNDYNAADKEFQVMLKRNNFLVEEKDKKVPVVDKLKEVAHKSTFFTFFQNALQSGDLNNLTKDKIEPGKLIKEDVLGRFARNRAPQFNTIR